MSNPPTMSSTCLYYLLLTLILYSIPTVKASPLPIPQEYPIHFNGSSPITDHGNSRILCVVPAPWTSLVVFYLANFVAHAATLVTYPGESPMSIIRGILGALCFPTSGITRGLDAIFRRATFEKTNLRSAARAGALCHVVRTDQWRPREVAVNRPETEHKSMGDLRDLKCDRNPNSGESSRRPSQDRHADDGEARTSHETHPCSDGHGPTVHIVHGAWMKEMPRFWPYFTTTLESPRSHDQQRPDRAGADLPLVGRLPQGLRQFVHSICSTDRRVHGQVNFSTLERNQKGYTLEYVPRNAQVEGLSTICPTTLARSYSLVKALVAIAQASYAVATLVKAAQTQVQDLGYASFGLTAAPYAIMSIVNLVGNLLTPQYDAVYLVETAVLQEAKEDGAVIDGQVGRLRTASTNAVVEIKINRPAAGRTNLIRGITRRLTRQSKTEDFKMTSLPSSDISLPPSGLSTPASNSQCTRSTYENSVLVMNTRKLHDMGNNLFIGFTSPRFERTDDDQVPRTKIKAIDIDPHRTARERWGVMKQRFHNRWFFSRRNRSEIGIPWYSYLFYCAMSLLVGSISLVVIGTVSGFEKRNSTHGQRAWIMSWIVFGVVIGVLVGFYNALLEYRSRRDEGLRTWAKLVYLIISLVMFAPPAVGGFVVVGQLLREYGNCATLSY